jgi:hypothetical protein
MILDDVRCLLSEESSDKCEIDCHKKQKNVNKVEIDFHLK